MTEEEPVDSQLFLVRDEVKRVVALSNGVVSSSTNIVLAFQVPLPFWFAISFGNFCDINLHCDAYSM